MRPGPNDSGKRKAILFREVISRIDTNPSRIVEGVSSLGPGQARGNQTARLVPPWEMLVSEENEGEKFQKACMQTNLRALT